MKMFTGFTRLASIPPHVKLTEFDNRQGFWSNHFEGQKLFIDAKTGKIWSPKNLRGQNPNDVTKQDFDSIPKEESGGYKLWLEDFNNKKNIDKLFSGFEFTSAGKILIDKWKKVIIKHKLDNVAVYSLDPVYSINPNLFDKLMSQTDLSRAKNMGKNICKKYKIIIEMLKETGKSRIANKIDGDFHFVYNKLEPLFDFDINSYNPKKTTKETDETEEINQSENLQNITNEFLDKARQLLDNQMSEFSAAMSKFMKTINKNNIPVSQKNYEEMVKILLKYVTVAPNHVVGQNAAKILQLPSLILLHKKLFVDSSI